mmetsp:Transcript_26547/g.65959  ORF Transcript_26547/g.65959 Transcript_26547/m.65959 type:complete len:306 (+) Transcript_26547:1506-2423(+)
MAERPGVKEVEHPKRHGMHHRRRQQLQPRHPFQNRRDEPKVQRLLQQALELRYGRRPRRQAGRLRPHQQEVDVQAIAQPQRPPALQPTQRPTRRRFEAHRAHPGPHCCRLLLLALSALLPLPLLDVLEVVGQLCRRHVEQRWEAPEKAADQREDEEGRVAGFTSRLHEVSAVHEPQPAVLAPLAAVEAGATGVGERPALNFHVPRHARELLVAPGDAVDNELDGWRHTVTDALQVTLERVSVPKCVRVDKILVDPILSELICGHVHLSPIPRLKIPHSHVSAVLTITRLRPPCSIAEHHPALCCC